jgi:hypothetical protein
MHEPQTQLPTTTTRRLAWNKGKLTGAQISAKAKAHLVDPEQGLSAQCPLYPQKRTFVGGKWISGFVAELAVQQFEISGATPV